MRKLFLLLVISSVGLSACEKLGLTKKDFRNDLEGYYVLNERCEQISALPDPPSGETKNENREIKVTKSEKDSVVIIEGVEYKLDKNFGYYKAEDFGSTEPYNYTLVKFFNRNKKDSLYIETSQGSVSLYEVCKVNAAFDRKLE